MNAPIASSLPSGLSRAFTALGDALASMMSLAEMLDAWLVSQRRHAQDRADLASMSERELADIGVPRSSIDATAHGTWTRGPMI